MLCITHLPQIAAYGTTHYRIAKTRQGRADGDRTSRRSSVRDREEELARMIGGADVSAVASRASAREMLKRRARRNQRILRRKAKAKVHPRAKAKVR